MAIKIPQLLLSLGLCLGAGVLGSFFTAQSIPTFIFSLDFQGEIT